MHRKSLEAAEKLKDGTVSEASSTGHEMSERCSSPSHNTSATSPSTPNIQSDIQSSADNLRNAEPTSEDATDLRTSNTISTHGSAHHMLHSSFHSNQLLRQRRSHDDEDDDDDERLLQNGTYVGLLFFDAKVKILEHFGEAESVAFPIDRWKASSLSPNNIMMHGGLEFRVGSKVLGLAFERIINRDYNLSQFGPETNCLPVLQARSKEPTKVKARSSYSP